MKMNRLTKLIKFALAVMGVVLFALGAWAEPSVQVGKTAQRYPWNGVVDVSYRVKEGTVGLKIKFTVTVGATDYDGGTVTLTAAGTVEGVHAIDLRKLGLEQSRGNATVKASVIAE